MSGAMERNKKIQSDLVRLDAPRDEEIDDSDSPELAWMQ